MMGMKGWLYWASWYFEFSLFCCLTGAIMTLLFHIKVKGAGVITYTDPTVTFVFLLLYGLSVMTLSFAITTFVSKGLIAVA